MAVLYRNAHYSEACYNEVALYYICNKFIVKQRILLIFLSVRKNVFCLGKFAD